MQLFLCITLFCNFNANYGRQVLFTGWLMKLGSAARSCARTSLPGEIEMSSDLDIRFVNKQRRR